MLNPFPSLLDFGFAAPLLVRVAVGLVFVYLTLPVLFSLLRGRKMRITLWLWSIPVALSALALIVGFYVQIGSLILGAMALIACIFKKYIALHADVRLLLFLFVLCCSLLLSGAGLFAFDVPL